MERLISVLMVTILAVSILSGCAGREKIREAPPMERGEQRLEERGLATSFGHPFRMVAFLLHPVGVIVDYVLVRPVYFVASLAPALFGYTAEDEAALRDAP